MITKILLLTLGLFSIASSYSQANIANELYDNYEYRNAIKFYEKDQPLKGENLNRLAQCYFYTFNYEKAVETYKKVMESKRVSTQDYLIYGEALKSNKQYNEALINFYKYQEAFPEDPIVADLIKGTGFLSRKENNETRYNVENFSKVNTKIANLYTKVRDNKVYYISETVDSKQGVQLQYDSTNDLDMLDYGTSVRPHAQLFVYDKAKNITLPFTTKEQYHINGFDIDFDAKEIYLTKIDITKKWKKGSRIPRIFKGTIDLEDYTIGELKAVDIPGFGKKDAIGHPALSPDKKHLYFSADILEQGLGDFDIYVSTLEKGKWSEPVNLGPTVNTPRSEIFPIIVDSNYIYFSSDGRIGYGNLDIYKARLITPSQAAESQILQEPINSFGDDFGFVYDNKTFSGYVTSNRYGGLGDDDIYKITLKKLIISGIVRDINGNPVEGAIVKLYDKDGNLVGESITDKDGKYSFKVNPGEYEVVVETPDGYIARRKISVDENWNNDQSIDLNLQTSVATIQGTVYNKKKRVSKKALVKLIAANGVEVEQAYVNSKGKYKFYAEPNASYKVIATTNGQAATKNIEVGKDWDNKQQVDLYMSKSTTAQGYLFNEDGSASPFTEISIYDENGKLIQQSKTDKDGRYQFNLDKNKNYQIKAKKKGFEGVENIYTGKNWRNDKDFNITMYPVTTKAYGYVKDLKSNKPVANVRVLLTDNKTSRKFITTTDENGYFSMNISNKRDYLLKLEKDKYYPRTIDVVHDETWGDSVDLSSKLNFDMEYAGYSVLNIYFELGSYKIRQDSKDQLGKIITVLEDRPKLKLHIRSYADCRGSNSANKKLTDKRSRAVIKYITGEGISKKRLTSESMGKTNFVNNCIRPKDCSEEEHGLNRRSEFEFR